VRTAKREDLPRARGFFGRARDLVARVIEKGLHLPDAADRLRQVTVSATQIAARVVPSVVPTVTLAEIYAAQGHRSRAIETLRRVIDLEPEHAAARSLLASLESAPASVRPPTASEDDDLPRAGAEVVPSFDGSSQAVISYADSEAETPRRWGGLSAGDGAGTRREPEGFLDDEPLPGAYDVDECVSIAVDPVTVYVYWEARRATLERLRRAQPTGTLTLRLLIVTPSWDGPRSLTRDFDIDVALADRVVRDLPAGSVVRAAIGWRDDGTFLPIAHAPALETPPGAPCPVRADAFVRWTPRGLAPIHEGDRDYASIGRALGHLMPLRDEAPPYALARPPIGSSELSAGFPAARESSPQDGSPGDARSTYGTAPSSEALL
jgi:hypothetical protein